MNNSNNKVWGVTCLFNPFRSSARYLNYMYFQNRIRRQGLKLVTVEMALKEQEYELVNRDSDILIQIKNDNKLWQKESLLNLGFQKIPDSAEVVCWIDADIILFDKHWVNNLLDKIRKYPVVHLFRSMVYLPQPVSKQIVGDFKIDDAPKFKIRYGNSITEVDKLSLKPILGSVAIFYETQKGKFINGKWGFGWAIRKNILDQVGGLYDRCIVGGGDTIFFNSVFWNTLHEKFKSRYTPAHQTDIQDYIQQLHSFINGRVGYLSGKMGHLWHGSFKSRNYFDRYQLLQRGHFHPRFDLSRDRGCLRWNHRYFRTMLSDDEKSHKDNMIKNVEDYLANRSLDNDSILYDQTVLRIRSILENRKNNILHI